MVKKSFIDRVALLVAEFFYCGRVPLLPGTAGSLGSLAIWVPLLYSGLPVTVNIFMLVVLFLIGVWASEYGIKHYQVSDPKQVVIDEVVGQGIPFLVISPRILEIGIAFLLFRFFDIVKPWPIRQVENRLQSKWGVMVDDVIAGVFAMIVIFVGKWLMQKA